MVPTEREMEIEMGEFEPRLVSAKFSYLGVCKKLHFALKYEKQELISLLLSVFNLPDEFKHALILKHANGKIYDEQTLKYQLEYFPKSNNIIFIRIDPTKVKPLDEDSLTREDVSNVVVAVFRQNCFLVASPNHISYRKRHKIPPRNSPPMKRRRLLIHSKKSKIINKDKLRI